ncbi:large subunit ribosomal protein L25 [Thermoleophilum album]|uniref:Large ribosomal subunit protein bL25 n=1 Tax=Thermoleophilum album TaxID=29539 RepID=A0A1H6FK18_THEAL|nr:large subunit ribosomal protein L25 [Thermoleophilum album]
MAPVAKRPLLEVEERSELGSRASRRLRRAGLIPGIIYGAEREPVPFKVPATRLRQVLAQGATIIDVKVGGGKPMPAVIKEQQHDPVRDLVVHVDLQQVRLDERVTATVPLELVGGEEAPGVRQGGVLEHVLWEVEIEALAGELPERVVADVSRLELGGTLTLGEVEPPEGVTLVGDPDAVVATIVPPTRAEEAAETVEEEPEVGGAEGAEEGQGS